MNNNLGLFYILAALKIVECVFSINSYISGGSFTKYTKYPHSILLFVYCEIPYICGASVLNQDIVLTAAHCMEKCRDPEDTTVYIMYGHEKIEKMNATSLNKFKVHKHYDEYAIINDICVLSTKEKIPLNDIVKRVIVMEKPPYKQHAYVAGWGVDEFDDINSKLKHTGAWVQERKVCEEIMGTLHDGIFCATPITGESSPRQGDSGGALMIKESIQIGIVSYSQKFDKTHTIVAYTNTSCYLKWINKYSKSLYCDL